MSAEPPSTDAVAVPSAALTVPSVAVDDRQSFAELDSHSWASLVALALAHEGVGANAEVGLAFVDLDEMTLLNVDHMGGTGPTDVLAFPIDGWDAVGPLAPAVGAPPAMIGDIIVCPAVAERSTSASQTLADELALLVVHGALHLIGHDHYEDDERDRMQAREQLLLSAFYLQDRRDIVRHGSGAGS